MNYEKIFGTVSSFFIILSVVSFAAVGIMVLAAPDTLENFFSTLAAQTHKLGLVGAALLMTLAALTAFPAELPAIACGAMYGLLPGFVVIWITAMLGASIAFAMGRYVNPALIEGIVGKIVFGAIRKRSNEKSGVASLFVVRLIPLFPFFIVNYASGLSGMRYHNYLLATGAGMIPGAMISSAIGAGMVTGNAVAILLIILTIFLLAISMKIYRGSKHRSAP